MAVPTEKIKNDMISGTDFFRKFGGWPQSTIAVNRIFDENRFLFRVEMYLFFTNPHHDVRHTADFFKLGDDVPGFFN